MVGGGGFRVFWGVLPVFGGVFTRGWCDFRFGAAVDDCVGGVDGGSDESVVVFHSGGLCGGFVGGR